MLSTKFAHSIPATWLIKLEWERNANLTHSPLKPSYIRRFFPSSSNSSYRIANHNSNWFVYFIWERICICSASYYVWRWLSIVFRGRDSRNLYLWVKKVRPLISTWITFPHSTRRWGRLLVFEVRNRKLRLEAETTLKGEIYALTNVNNMIAAGVHSQVCLSITTDCIYVTFSRDKANTLCCLQTGATFWMEAGCWWSQWVVPSVYSPR